MGLRFRITATPPEGPLGHPEDIPKLAASVFEPAIDEATLLAEREIKDGTPIGATEALHGSVQSATETVRGAGVIEFRGEVVVNALHGVPVEQGTRPHWAPIGPLKLWARRKLGDENAAYAVQFKIAQQGTRPTRFFSDAVARVESAIRALLTGASATYVNRMRGES